METILTKYYFVELNSRELRTVIPDAIVAGGKVMVSLAMLGAPLMSHHFPYANLWKDLSGHHLKTVQNYLTGASCSTP